MRYREFPIFALIVLGLVALASPPALLAETTSDVPLPGEELTWPRVHEGDGVSIFLYQPQIEKWDGDDIESRMAVGVQTPGDRSPVYGVVWMSAKADVDKAARIVTIKDFKVTRARFPTRPSREKEYLKLVREYIPQGVRTVALDHLEASFAISQAVKKAKAVKVKNDPPRIIFSTTPALLILVDGKPVLRPVEGQNAERIINTQALILRSGGKYYLQAMGYWYQASGLEGPWIAGIKVPSFLESIKESLAAGKQVDVIEPSPDGKPPGIPPTIYVSTVPAEVIQTEGRPEYLPIEGTDLLQVKNSDDVIFMDVKKNFYYVLLSGRWFKANGLSGPWAFVPGKDLPTDLAKIPPDHPRGNALASVPGTPQAEEAVIANSIPQTSTIRRSEASVAVPYDGIPRFEPIEGTPLQYAVNSPLPVIEIDGNSFYCVQNGVWFAATSPDGPWVVATSVPAVIYSIPPSSPLFYVTYVRVYGFTPDYVYEGYTPGYLGTVVSPEGVVVYGTGYTYPPYIGSDWIGWPYTYGFGAEIAWGAYTGFAFGFAAGAVWGGWGHPWWGPVGWGWQHGWRYTHVNMNHVNVYHHWGREVTIINHPYGRNEFRDGRWSHTGGRIFNPNSGRRIIGEKNWDANIRRFAPRPQTSLEGLRPQASREAPRPRGARTSVPRNNVYGGRDGQVYRYSGSGNWKRSTHSGWQAVNRQQGFQSQRQELNRERTSRDIGYQIFNSHRSSGVFQGGIFPAMRGESRERRR